MSVTSSFDESHVQPAFARLREDLNGLQTLAWTIALAIDGSSDFKTDDLTEIAPIKQAAEECFIQHSEGCKLYRTADNIV